MPAAPRFEASAVQVRNPWHRSTSTVAWLVFLAVGIGLGPRGDLPRASAATTSGSTARTSDQTAEALLGAMKGQDYAAAFGLFDSTMRAAVPVEKLKAVWTVQLASLGNLTSWSMTRRQEIQGRDLRVALLQFERGQLEATILVNPGTQDVGTFLVRPYAPPAPPAAYVDPSRFDAIDVTVGGEAFPLGGTLTLPKGGGPFPAVVLVHGSGPNDRDETVGGSKIFKDLAEGLASRGIATLRYDKRTFRYGAKLGSSISVDDEVIVDAVAAVKLLAARSDVDHARIFVAGHSMGAALAPEIGVRSGAVAGVTLLSPPGRAPWELLLSQLRYLGAPQDQIDDAEKKVALIKSGKVEGETLLGAPLAYWKELGSHDGIAMATKLGRPVLILHGDRDYQVLDADIQAWRVGLAKTANVSVETFPTLNHLFIAGSGKSGPAEYGVPGHVDVQVIDRLASFIAPARRDAH